MIVDKDRMKNTFTDLVTIYAPSGKERGVADYLKERLAVLGAADVVEDNQGSINGGNAGNVIAHFPATAEGLPSIAFTAHMDCVENCKDIVPVLADGVFRSQGDTILGGDDKAGVTAILEGLALLRDYPVPHGPITAIFTVQEETGLYGSQNIEEKYIQGIDFGYTLDGDGEAGYAYNAGPSQVNLTFTCHGVASHAGVAPEKGTNAIKLAAHAISRCPSGRIDEETTCNLGTITGGTATNIVPDLCVVKGEARSRDPEKLQKLVDHMEEAFARAADAFPGGSVDTVADKSYDAFIIPKDTLPVQLFTRAVSAMGKAVHIAPSGGGSDANWFGTKGFPSLLVGVGMKDFHTNKENLEEKDLYEAGELVYRIVAAEE